MSEKEGELGHKCNVISLLRNFRLALQRQRKRKVGVVCSKVDNVMDGDA